MKMKARSDRENYLHTHGKFGARLPRPHKVSPLAERLSVYRYSQRAWGDNLRRFLAPLPLGRGRGEGLTLRAAQPISYIAAPNKKNTQARRADRIVEKTNPCVPNPEGVTFSMAKNYITPSGF